MEPLVLLCQSSEFGRSDEGEIGRIEEEDRPAAVADLLAHADLAEVPPRRLVRVQLEVRDLVPQPLARGEQVFQSHFGKDPRDGFLRGTPKDTLAMLQRFRDAGCVRANIAFREGPYDWDALHAFAETVFPVFSILRPT